ncbi:MAG: ATP-binding cassette domain-containing protein [Rhodospirillales bacterium]
MPDGSGLTLDAGQGRDEASIRPLRGMNLEIARKGLPLLQVDDIAFQGVGLSVVMGANGAGKSLLLRVLAGLVQPDRGRVLWGRQPPQRRRRQRLGYVFQKPVLLRRSALANVVYPLRAAGVGATAARDQALQALAGARLDDLARRPARVLSGGEQQRLALARALALRPEVLFLDEPTASLDPASTLAIEQMILSARAAGTGIVLVTHDAGQARRLADEVVFLHRGRIVERAAAERFFAAPASREAAAYLAGEIVV